MTSYKNFLCTYCFRETIYLHCYLKRKGLTPLLVVLALTSQNQKIYCTELIQEVPGNHINFKSLTTSLLIIQINKATNNICQIFISNLSPLIQSSSFIFLHPSTFHVALLNQPPFFGQNTCGILTLSLLACLVAGVTCCITRKKHNLKLHELNREKKHLNLEISSLNSKINPHVFSNILSRIQYTISQEENEKAMNQIQLYNTYMRSLIDKTSKTLITVEEEFNLLQAYINAENINRDLIKLTLTTEHTNLKYYIPSLSLQPVVENAIKHGFESIQLNKIINISVTRKNNCLEVLIFNNGKPFQNRNAPSFWSGYGLNNVQLRIEHLNQIYKSNCSPIIIRNVYNSQAQYLGVEVKIIFPVIVNPKI